MILTAALFVLAQSATAPAKSAAPAAPAKPAASAPQLPTKTALEARVRAQFAEMDTNHDGKVDKAEATAFRAKIVADAQKRRGQQVAAAFDKFDANHDGSISRQEFEAATGGKLAAADGPGPWFDNNDIDKNGVVVLNEAVAKADRQFEMIDKNNDGVISREEIAAFRSRARPAANK